MNIVDFVSVVDDFLVKTCVGAVTVPRGEVLRATGLPEKNAQLITELIDLGFLPGYKIRTGPGGGVCRLDAPEPQKSNKMDAAFLQDLLGVLETHVPPVSGGSVTRGQLAAHMGIPSGETEARISKAINAGHCPGFTSRRGLGVFRLPPVTLSADGVEESEVVVASMKPTPLEESPAVVVTETVETVKPKKSKKTAK